MQTVQELIKEQQAVEAKRAELDARIGKLSVADIRAMREICKSVAVNIPEDRFADVERVLDKMEAK